MQISVNIFFLIMHLLKSNKRNRKKWILYNEKITLRVRIV